MVFSVSLSDVQQSDSVICVSVYISSLFRFFSLISYYEILGMVFCAIQVGPCLLPILCIVVYILEKAMAPHSSTLAWKISWMEEPGRLQSMGSLRVGHD